MDITQRVQILIGGDASQAKKVIKEVENEIKSSQARQKANAGQTGTQVGDAYGRAFNRAQDRWLNMAENGFRRWGGRVGGIIADVLGAFDKADKTMYATERLGRVGSRTARSIEAEAMGTALGNAASAGLGAGVGSGVGVKTMHEHYNGKTAGVVGSFTTKPISAIAGNHRIGMRGRLNKLAEKTPLLGPLLGYDISNIFGKGIPKLGALVAGVNVAVKAFESLGKAYEEIQEKQNTFTKNQAVIDNINGIGNSVERTRAILQQFGKDGQEAFRKLVEEQAKLKESLSDTSMVIAKYNAKATSEGISGLFSGIWKGVKRGATGAFNWIGGLGRGLRAWVGRDDQRVDAEFVNEINQSNLDTLKMQQKVDESNEKRLKQKDEEIKAEKELQELRWKVKSDDDKERELKNAVELLKAKKDQTNATKDILEYEKALADLEEIKAKKARETAEARERAADAAQRENEARGRELERRYNDQSRNLLEIEDRSRFGISDLAGTNSVAGNAAKRVQLLESNAKQARLGGNHALAEQLINSANVIRRNLGAAGILQSDEYGSMFPVTPTSRRTSYDIARDVFNYQGAITRFGDRIGYGRLQDAAMDRMAELQSGRRYIGTLDEFFAANNYIPVRPRNGA